MMYKRKLRESGDSLLLGTTQYFIEELEGCGGSSVVYQAFYQDGLNRDSFHQVLIKELYPYDDKGRIYRDANGEICCTEDAAKEMESAKIRFRQGNEINLELLEEMPSQTSGNLNSYEAYGTYYSVLTLHGGKNLQKLIETRDGRNGLTLREAAVLTGKILDALAHFHKKGMLHLDISPDNVLVLPEQAMLIDYNSAWNMEEGAGGEYVFSTKRGYSAPEILLQDDSEVGYFSDLYSVCAVFFRMLTGRILTEKEQKGSSLEKVLRPSLKIFQKEPVSAVHKAVQILWKGLHMLAHIRYQNVEELREDLQELINRLDGKGVSRSALWESSHRQCEKIRHMDSEYLPQDIRLPDGRCLTPEGVMEYLKNGNRLLLTGQGGMGKSRLLKELWGAEIREYRPSAPVVCYVSLKEYHEMPDSADYIQNCLLRELVFPNAGSAEDARRQLRHIFEEKQGDRPGLVLLLDGLNEAGNNCRGLLEEIEMIAGYAGTCILVTDRTEHVKQYGLYAFETAQLQPLSKDTVSQALLICEVSEPEGEECWSLLTNPMMLELYIQTGGRREQAVVSKADDLVQAYVSHLQRLQLRNDTGDEAAQLCVCYVFGHLLPQIALQMQKQEASLLSFEQLLEILKRSYHDLKEPSFGKVFPEYCGKSREMLGSIQNESEWFDYAAVYLLMKQAGILVKTTGGYFGLIHDNFIPCLAKNGRKHAEQLQMHNRKIKFAKIRKIVLACILPILAAAVIAGTVSFWAREQQEVTQMAASQVLISMRTLNGQLGAQRFMTDSVKESGMLEESFSYRCNMQELRDNIKKRIAEESQNKTSNGYRDLMPVLEQKDTGICADSFARLCKRPESMKKIMQNLALFMDYCLFESDASAGQKADIVDRYDSYLDDYTQVCVYELYLVRCGLTGECREDFDKAVTYLGQMRELYRKLLDGRDGKGSSPENIQSALNMLFNTGYKNSKEDLKIKIKNTIGEEYTFCLDEGEDDYDE